MFGILLFPLKALAAILSLFAFFATTFCLYPVLLINPFFGRKLIVHISRFYSVITIRILGINVHLHGQKHLLKKKQASLIICNHQSYLDILIIASYFPSSFVTSMQMKETPFLGHMSILSGCLFVERRNKSNIHNEVRELTENLKKGNNVIVFPEATSTNGDAILRFRRPLFQSAIDAQIPITPLCLNYKSVNGVKISKTNRDKICWYGDMPFLSHILQLLCLLNLKVDFHIMQPIVPSTDWEKTTLAETTQKIVEKKFLPLN